MPALARGAVEAVAASLQERGIQPRVACADTRPWIELLQLVQHTALQFLDAVDSSVRGERSGASAQPGGSR
jgi:hypothetical protein